MHKKLYILLVLVAALFSCGKNRIDDPEFGAGDYPRIFDILNAFQSPTRIINAGDTAKYNGLLFSPAGKVKISWKVNGEQKSTDTIFSFAPVTGGEFTVELEAEFNGLKSTRATKILVSPDSYTPKPFTKVVMAYLSSAGTAQDVDFENLTHIAFQAGRVSADGSLDVSAGEINQHMDELVARAHIAGRPAMISITGRLSGMDGWALYEANDFGQAIQGTASRAALVTSLAAYVNAKKLDGVDILMTDINSGAYAANVAAIAPFITALKAAMPAGKLVTVNVGAGWQHWDYPDLAAADWVNVRAFEDNLHVGPAAPRGQSSSYDYMLAAAKIWADFHLPANKLVIGIPAFGMRYTAIDANGNNEGWASYEYLSYKAILGIDATASGKEMIDNAFGVYFNGKPLVKKKGDFLKTSAYKGAFLWATDFDSMNEHSLLKELYNALK